MPDHLKNKMYDFEVKPPEELWQKVSSELESSNEFLELSKRMYDFEATPPTQSWNNISASINEVPAGRVIKMRPVIMKLTAAAVIAAIIIGSSIYLLSDNDGGSKMAATGKSSHRNSG